MQDRIDFIYLLSSNGEMRIKHSIRRGKYLYIHMTIYYKEYIIYKNIFIFLNYILIFMYILIYISGAKKS